jgi:hypothetical protein
MAIGRQPLVQQNNKLYGFLSLKNIEAPLKDIENIINNGTQAKHCGHEQ